DIAIGPGHLAFRREPVARRNLATTAAPMASSISRWLTGFRRLPRTIPLSSSNGILSPLRTILPSESNIKSMRSPAFKPSRSRTTRGMVTCPLLVRVAVAIGLLTYGKTHCSPAARRVEGQHIVALLQHARATQPAVALFRGEMLRMLH